MSNLGKRVLTAAVGVPLVFALIYAGGVAFLLLIAVVIVLCMVELGRLVAAKGGTLRVPLVTVLAVAVAVAAWLGGQFYMSAAYVAAVVVLLVVEVMGGVVKNSMARLGYALLALTYAGLLPSHFLVLRRSTLSSPLADAAASLALRDPGFMFLVFVVAVTFVHDTSAFFVGKRAGTLRLLPTVSPAKTVEGTLGGALGAVVTAVVVDFIFGTPFPPYLVALWGLVLAVAATFGDLVESMLKRDAEIKDTGGVLPGHGGVLDRLDSLLFTVPVSFYFVVFCLGGKG